jgi:hypothetical protein
MAPVVTLLELVKVVADYARTDSEVVATVVHLVNSGTVRLGGNFRGARIDLGANDHGGGHPAAA